MRVVRLKAPGGVENFKIVEENYPQPKPGEILVRIHACSLNFHDLMVAQGKKPCADGRIPLSDGAGEVLAVGDAVNDFVVGDSVVSTYWPSWPDGEPMPAFKTGELGDDVDGYAREYVCAPACNFTKAPIGYTYREASTLTCAGVTAWRGLVINGRVKQGDTVLVLGTGAVSIFALQFAKAAGARVIATSSSEEKLDKLKRLGADFCINYRTVPDWGQRAKDITDGRGVDHVVEVGGPGTFAQSVTACRMGGHIALIGVLTGFVAEIPIPALFSSQIRVQGVSIGSRADQLSMIRALEANRLKPVIARSFPVQEIGAAFEYYGSQKHFGKVCIEM